MLIRAPQISEFDRVMDLWVEMCEESGNTTYNKFFWFQNTMALMQSGTYSILVADNGKGEIVGFIDGVHIIDPSSGGLVSQGRHLFVTQKYRNKGVAAKLLKEARAIDLMKGCKKVFIMTDSGTKLAWNKHGYKQAMTVYEAIL